MNNRITQVLPSVGKTELEYLSKSIKEKWLTEGPMCQDFLNHILEFTGSKYAVLAPNGTLGLFLGLLALDLPADSEIIIPDFTFFASSSSAIFAGLTPVFVDVDNETFNIDPDKIEQAITNKTKAIMPVHIYGQSANMERIMNIAEQYNLKVIEDAAQAYGVFYKDRHCGTFGDVSVISFFADKTITMGEGAVLLTQNEAIYNKLKLLRNQGRENSGTFIHSSVGMNFRLTDLQCGVGLAQARKFPQILQKKSEYYEIYYQLLKGVGDLTFLKLEKQSSFVPFRFFIRTNYKEALISFLDNSGIDVREFFFPMSEQPPLKKYNISPDNIIVSKKLYETGLCLPIHDSLTKENIKYICDRVKEFFKSERGDV